MNPYRDLRFYSNAVTDSMESIIKECVSFHTETKGAWIKEFIAMLLKKHDVKIVSQMDNGYLVERILVGEKIVSSYRSRGIGCDVWRDKEFYEIEKDTTK